jgi:phosphoglycerate dehydrogenase-like enzyme
MSGRRLIIDLRSEQPCWTAGERERALLAAVPGWTVTLAADDHDRRRLLTGGADAIWCWRLDASEVATCPGLRWVATPAAGADYLDCRGLRARGLVVTISHGHHGPAMAEHALGMLLALARDLPAQHARLAGGAWRPTDLAGRMVDLLGGHLVIAGYGAIGREVAQRAAGFGLRLSGLCRRDRGTDDLEVRILGPADHDAALATATAVVNLLPHTPTTANWFDARRLALLPPDCIFINLGRGRTVDDDALVTVIRAGRLRAGLDVFTIEPLPATHPLRSLPNVLLTPHASAATREYLLRAARAQAEQMTRFRDGRELLWQVTDDLWVDRPISLDR